MPLVSDDSDELHNKNAWNYLRCLDVSADPVSFESGDQLAEELCSCLCQVREFKNSAYKESFAYGDLYTNFLILLEQYIERYFARHNNYPDELLVLVNSIYQNYSDPLGESWQAVSNLAEVVNQTEDLEDSVMESLSSSRRKVNVVNPSSVGSRWSRFKTLFSSHYKPMQHTSFPTLRQYHYQRHLMEVRCGTQAQRHDGKTRVSPLFEMWCAKQNSFSGTITHVYFNNLARDRGRFSFARHETVLTNELHRLEQRQPHIAVITLPADGGLLSVGELAQSKHFLMQDTKKLILDIAANNGQDFCISKNVKQLLYGEDSRGYSFEQEKEKLIELLNKSISALGLGRKANLTVRERQALYFHFIKFELTNFILEKLQPKSFNVSCKDGIDRAGVASIYYNLVKSIELRNPLAEEEFLRGLHGAAVMVKARSVNFHIKVLWNAVDQYINANLKSLRGLNLRWLIDWRDKNRPLFAGLQRDAISTVDSSFDQVPAIQGTSKFILSDLGGAGSVQEISPIVLEAGENPEAFMADPLLAHKLEDYMEQYPQQFMIR